MKTNLLIILGLMLLAGTANALNQMTLVAQYDGESDHNNFGEKMTMGDFDADGAEEFFIGAPGWNNYRGRNYYYDWAGNWPTAPTWTFQGLVDNTCYDIVDQNVGDLNGDGMDDFGLVEIYDGPTPERLDILWGGADFDTLADWSLGSGTSFYDFGYFLDSCGDVNGDGGNDIIFEVMSSIWSQERIYFGGDVLDTIPDWQVSRAYQRMVFGLGDVNGDGMADFLLTGFNDEPVELFFGGDPPDTIADLVFYDYAFDGIGNGVGDVNGDHYSDFCLTMSLPDSQYVYAAVYLGGPEVDAIPDLFLQNMYGEPWPAMMSLSCGDLNGDGYSDIISGTFQSPFGHSIYIYLGGPGFNPVPDVLIGSWSAYDGYGSSVASGDVNGDGCDDLLVGAPDYGWGFMIGRAYLYTGPAEWIDYGAAVSPEILPRQPQGFLLAQNFPNPFNSSTSIHFELARPGIVNLTVYDLRGNQIKNLISSEQMTPGGYNVSWTGVNENQQSVSSGIYLLELKLNQYRQVRKIALLR